MVAKAQHRVIDGLRWAQMPKHKPPGCLGVSKRLRGAKAEGRRFENNVVKMLKAWEQVGQLPANLQAGQWFEFEDKHGHGYCQPDILLYDREKIVILECKLTQTDVAFEQMEELYVPVLQRAFGLEVFTVQVCKNLRHANDTMLDCLVEFFCEPRFGRFTYHIPNPQLLKLQIGGN